MPDLNPVQAQLAMLRKKYALALPEKAAALQVAVAPLFEETWQEQAWSSAYRQVHSLAGSSGTYGYPEISSIARALETLIHQGLASRVPLADVRRTQVEEL